MSDDLKFVNVKVRAVMPPPMIMLPTIIPLPEVSVVPFGPIHSIDSPSIETIALKVYELPAMGGWLSVTVTFAGGRGCEAVYIYTRTGIYIKCIIIIILYYQGLIELP